MGNGKVSALLVLAALLWPAPRHLADAGPAVVQACRDYPIAVRQTWTVGQEIAHFLQPGNETLRGPAVPREWRRPSIFVNGSMPGPVLRATKGDWVQVDVINNLVNRLITIHWHGIVQLGTPWSDGTAMVNSCPVVPGETVPYVWRANDAGTYFWHGHAGFEHDYGVNGAIVITDPNDPHAHLYDEELPAGPVLVQDWWLDPDGIYANNFAFGFFGTLEGAVVNGQSGDGVNYPYATFEVQQGRCYRLRFIHAGTQWPGWTVTLAGLNMTIIAMDANNVSPLNVTGFVFYIGQRVDAVVCADGPLGDHMLTFTSALQPGPNVNTTSAIIRVVPNTSNVASRANRTALAAAARVPDNGGLLDTAKNAALVKTAPAIPPPTKASATWNVYVGFGAVHGYAWTERDTPLQLSMTPPLFSQAKCDASKNLLYKTVAKKDTVVDIIINNLNSDAHPMHLHGHDFWVLGTHYITTSQDSVSYDNNTLCPGQAMVSASIFEGPGVPGFAWGCPYNATHDKGKLNTATPWVTDTAILPPRSWVYIRVKFSNPGWWFLHCHVNNHMEDGMGFLINVAPSQQPIIPAWVNTRCSACGAVKQQCNTDEPSFKCTTKAPQYCAPKGLMSGMSMGK